MPFKALIKNYKSDRIYRIVRIFFAFPPARHLPVIASRSGEADGSRAAQARQAGKKGKKCQPSSKELMGLIAAKV